MASVKDVIGQKAASAAGAAAEVREKVVESASSTAQAARATVQQYLKRVYEEAATVQQSLSKRANATVHQAIAVVSAAKGRVSALQQEVQDKGVKTLVQENMDIVRASLSETTKSVNSQVQVASEATLERARELKALTAEKAEKAYRQSEEFAGREDVRTTAKGAAAGAAVMGSTGAAAGAVTGGLAGAAMGLPLALFTLGLSVPIGAAVGGGVGAVAGSGVGVGGGALTGGAAGYTYHRKDDIQSVAQSAWAHGSEKVEDAKCQAGLLVEQAKCAVVSAKERLTTAPA